MVFKVFCIEHKYFRRIFVPRQKKKTCAFNGVFFFLNHSKNILLFCSIYLIMHAQTIMIKKSQSISALRTLIPWKWSNAIIFCTNVTTHFYNVHLGNTYHIIIQEWGINYKSNTIRRIRSHFNAKSFFLATRLNFTDASTKIMIRQPFL